MLEYSGHRQAQSEATRGGLPIRSPRIRRFNSRGYQDLCLPPPELLTGQ